MSLLLILSFLGFVPTPAEAAIISPLTVEYSTTTAPLILTAFASRYHINADQFIATAKCESGFNAQARGDYVKGTATSLGLFQINLPSHTDVSKGEALDPWFAAEWSAKEWAAGRQSEWTCWRNLYGKKLTRE